MRQTKDVVFLSAVRNTRPVAQCHDAPSEIATAPGPSRPGRSRKHAQVLDAICQAAIGPEATKEYGRSAGLWRCREGQLPLAIRAEPGRGRSRD